MLVCESGVVISLGASLLPTSSGVARLGLPAEKPVTRGPGDHLSVVIDWSSFSRRGVARGGQGRLAARSESPADEAVWHVSSRAELRERRDSNPRPPA